MKEHLAPRGIDFIDKAISAPGAAFIRQVLEQRRRTSMRILDMGIGYSTMFVGDWMAEQPDAWWMEYVGVEHDAEWRAFVTECVHVHGDYALSPRGKRFPCTVVHREPHDHTDPPWRRQSFDVIIVDHGDGKGTDLDTRAADTPWLSTMLRRDGIMLFDDWRPKHEGRIRRALPEGWVIGAAEWTRRYPRDKAIGWAVRG